MARIPARALPNALAALKKTMVSSTSAWPDALAHYYHYPLLTMTTSRNSTNHALYAIIAMSVVAILFFDVIFLKSSLQPSNIVAHIGAPQNFQYSAYIQPDHNDVTPSHGYSDLGSTSWQSEPARSFMASSLRNHELPYWNPYSANGSLAPDTLVDLKFSVFTLLSAWFLDSSAGSFDFGLMIIFFIAAFCLLKITHEYFGLTPIACLFVVLVFFMNGFATTNYNSQNGQAYFFAPLLLLSLRMWSEKPTLFRWIAMTLCHGIMFLITMLPVTLLSLITCHLLNLTWSANRKTSLKELSKNLSLVFLSGCVALLLCAFFWVPVIHNMTVTSLFNDYGERSALNPYHWHNLISIFTPKQFWESYNGIRPLEELKKAGIQHDWGTLAHLGLGSLLIASTVFHKRILLGSPHKWLIMVLTVLFIIPYARIFGLLPILDNTPAFNIIGRQYWMCMSSLAFSFLAGFGLHYLYSEKTQPYFALIMAALAMFCFWSLYSLLGMPNKEPYQTYTARLEIFFIIYALLFFFYSLFSKSQKWLVILLLITSFAELFLYINHLRPVRFSAKENAPEFVVFLQKNLGDYRVLNIGERKTLQPEFGSMYGIRQLDTNNSSLLPWYKTFYKQSFGTENPLFLLLGSSTLRAKKPLQPDTLDLTALNIASAKYIVVSPAAKLYVDFLREKKFPLVFEASQTLIFENTQARPIAYSSNQWSNSDDLHNIQTPQAIITEDEEMIQQLNIHQINKQGLCPAPEIVAYKNNEVLYKTNCDFSNVLATSDTWHPQWRASIDGKPIRVGKINNAFRGVIVPDGKHNIRLYFAPPGIKIGMAITLVTCLFVFILFMAALVFELTATKKHG